MKLLITSFFFCTLLSTAIAQPTLSFARQHGTMSALEDYSSSLLGQRDPFFDKVTVFGIGYQYRLKAKRIDFHPNLTFSFFSKEEFGGFGFTSISNSTIFRMNQHNLNLDVKFYLFNLNASTTQPALLSDRGILKKNFYVFVSPSLTMLRVRYSYSPNGIIGSSEAELGELYFRGTIGIGLDLPVRRGLTFSPFVALHRITGLSNQIIDEHFNDLCVGCNLTTSSIAGSEEDYIHASLGVNIIFGFLD